MNELKALCNTTLNNYFNYISLGNIVNSDTMQNVLILLFLDDIYNKMMYIPEEEELKLSFKLIDCISNNDCIIENYNSKFLNSILEKDFKVLKTRLTE